MLNLPTVPFGWDISVRHWLYYEAWVVAGILFFVAWMLVRGRTGRAWRAIRDGEIAATASGVSPALYKTLAFGVSSFYAGVAGALLAIEVSYVNPDTFPLSLSILLLASVVVGGLGALSGVIFGALLLEFLPIYAQDPPLLPFELSKQSPTVIFGVILILIMFVLPGGVASLIRRATAPIVRNLNRPKRRSRSRSCFPSRLSVRFEVMATRTLHPDRTRQRELRREELLDAADRIVRAGGRDTSMEEIAAEAGITKPILYRHFGDKDGLHEALAERYVELKEALLPAGKARGARERLAATIDAYLAYVEREPERYRFLLAAAERSRTAELMADFRRSAWSAAPTPPRRTSAASGSRPPSASSGPTPSRA